MTAYIWVTVGSALGGLLRYGLTRLTLDASARFPWGTIGINVLGCFVLGFFGTLTLANGRFPAPDHVRLFVMVGLCGGFTTFSAFSLQTFDLVRFGAWGHALANVTLSVVLCFLSVALGHVIAQHTFRSAPAPGSGSAGSLLFPGESILAQQSTIVAQAGSTLTPSSFVATDSDAGPCEAER